MLLHSSGDTGRFADMLLVKGHVSMQPMTTDIVVIQCSMSSILQRRNFLRVLSHFRAETAGSTCLKLVMVVCSTSRTDIG